MKVICTLDYVDGSKGKSREMYIDQIDTSFLLMNLMSQSVAGLTITRVYRLDKLSDMMKETDDDQQT